MKDGHELTFPPDGSVLRDVRARVRRLAGSLGAVASVCDNLALIVDELVNNAIEHGAVYRRKHLDLAVRLALHGDRLGIEFHDPEMPAEAVAELARGLDATTNGMPSLDSERGRGLFLLSIYLQGLRAEAAAAGGLRLTGFIPRQ